MNASTQNAIPLALCITDLEVGGAERIFTELALGLSETEFAPHVFVLSRRPRAPDAQLAERLEAAGIPVEFLGARQVWHFPSIVKRLRRYFLALRPAIVQSFLWHANCSAALAAKRAGVKHALTGIRVAERRVRGHHWLARRLANLAEYHVCVSQSVAEFSTAVGRLPPERLVVIPNGIDAARYPAKPAPLPELGLEPSRKLALAIGRLEPQKRFDELLAAAPDLFQQEPNCQIAIVGAGPSRARLEAMREQLGANARYVHLLGRRDDAARILAAADVLALTSRWEGMPNVVLEAMASGKPVVAADVEGVRELLGMSSQAALGAQPQVYTPGRPAELASKLAALLADTTLAAQLGAANRQRAAEHFALAAMIERYAALYRAILAGETPSRLFVPAAR